MFPSGSSTIASPKGRGFKSHSHQYIFCPPSLEEAIAFWPHVAFVQTRLFARFSLTAEEADQTSGGCSVTKRWDHIDLEPLLAGICAPERQQYNIYPEWKQVGIIMFASFCWDGRSRSAVALATYHTSCTAGCCCEKALPFRAFAAPY